MPETTSRTLRVAIAGCGGMGTRHAGILGKLAGAEVTLLVDPNPEAIDRLRQRANLTDAQGIVSLADPAFNELCDAVVIATHHDLHPTMAIAAAEAGKHIYIEKPLALTVAGCQQIEAAVQRGGVQLVVGFQARHASVVQLARQGVPKPRVLTGQMIDPKWPDGRWSQDPQTGGGNVLSQGVHTLDLLCYLAGGEPVTVHAEGGTLTHQPGATAIIDSVLATIRFDNDTLATAAIGDFGPDTYVGKSFYQLFDAQGRSATIYGHYTGVRIYDGDSFVDYTPNQVSRGRMATGTGVPGRAPLIESTEKSTDHLSDLAKLDLTGPKGYPGALAEFVECSLENRPPITAADARSGTRATRLAHACFESIRTGRRVDLDNAGK